MTWSSSEMFGRRKTRRLMINVGDGGMRVNIEEWH